MQAPIHVEEESVPFQSVGRILKMAKEARDMVSLLLKLGEIGIKPKVFRFEGYFQGVTNGPPTHGSMELRGMKTYYQSVLSIGDRTVYHRGKETGYRGRDKMHRLSRPYLVIWQKSHIPFDGTAGWQEFAMVPLPSLDDFE